MGRIHEVQQELVERIRERDIARGQLRECKLQLDEGRALIESMRAVIAERPLPTKLGWKMPEAKCPSCGTSMRTEALCEGEIILGFAEECDGCNNLFDIGPRMEEFEWPFEAEIAWPSDLEHIGFEVV